MNIESNVGIVFSDFGPYHAARINALARTLKQKKVSLISFRFSGSSETYSWDPVMPEETLVITLGHKYPTGILESLKMGVQFIKKLKHHKTKYVFLPSYSPLPNLVCLLCVKLLRYKAILMNDSWSGTERAGYFSRIIKRVLVKMFDAGLVAGTPQREYVVEYGLEQSKVFLGYDVVDVNYFLDQSMRWRKLQLSELPIPNLPSRFFLSLGRFVAKKNLKLLIEAYALVVQQTPFLSTALVLVGEGSEEQHLRKLVNNLSLPLRNGIDLLSKPSLGPEVVFYPFQQVDITPVFFSRCDCFVLPSAYEEWGLVVNEAMASGAPVLVSDKVGCVQDLVINGENGYVFSPDDVHTLSNLLRHFVTNQSLVEKLGNSGQHHISNWGLDRFVDGALNALNTIK